MQTVCIALVGDFSAAMTAHHALNESVRLASSRQSIDAQWLHTSHLQPRDEQALASFHGVWCVPGSPYANPDSALWAIEWARTRNVPFLGTCGGFQHAVLEFVRHVLGRDQAAHAELESSAAFPLIAPLACALVEKSERILPTSRGRFAQWYGVSPRIEGFHCSFGLNPNYETLLENSGLEVVARGEQGEVRAVELVGHPFFIGTLFQPERSALGGKLHPLVDAFLQAAAQRESSPAAARIR
jgi:CTP synthase (UTP-ammonia lyase)